ncbi:adenylate/guanylate cyclase domain-containing protein [Kordiimonas laminariae]|uniref:adenylate/guanylate cyclase domain-containing protein n=1 Tax=Kordiimonas laminariae TaxID=2917717 RepID=UPI001FF34B40|nr:adenylate/guanylate cyclase domain-containing protein [Kordiimonas laminariae]MCK0070825.1 TRAFs-binding domain-containing protein [Kordiimonas laminariae]
MSPTEQYNSILTLLRAGALEQAEKEYFRLGLDTVSDNEDILALGGRLLKSRMVESHQSHKQELARQAAEKYYHAYEATGGTYTGINTAAMQMLAGDIDNARATADEVLHKTRGYSPKPGQDAYYHMATVAEAYFILGDHVRAETNLTDAISLDPENYDAHASTLKQFELLATVNNADISWLDKFRPPKTLHFAGHIFGLDGDGNVLDEASVYGLGKSILDKILSENIGYVYGALAAGSDILIAEKALEANAEFHLVLPCPDELFLETSVVPFGEHWVPRFWACKAAAKTVRYLSGDNLKTDDMFTAFASETAMGLAVLKAERLATKPLQLLIWDQKNPTAKAGTARDAKVWEQAGRDQIIIPYPRDTRKATGAGDNAEELTASRDLKAMVFADVRGFGALTDSQVPVFIDKILRPLAICVNTQGRQLEHLNTWGDGLFLVLDSVEAAANVASDLQETFRAIDLAEIGLPEFLALRIGGHYGPVHEMRDPFTNRIGVFGTEVAFAARIEPVTVPGSIYVSEPFACALALSAEEKYRCETVGKVEARKGQQALKLFSLRVR